MIFRKLLSFTLASSMLLASAQLISNEPAAQAEDCQEALAKAEDAQYTAQNALMTANDAQWQIHNAKTQAQSAIDAAKQETEWAKQNAAIAQQEAQVAQKQSNELAHAVLGLVYAGVEFGGICYYATHYNPASFVDNLCLGVATTTLGVLAATPISYENRNTNALKNITKTLALLGVFMSGGIIGEKFGARAIIG